MDLDDASLDKMMGPLRNAQEARQACEALGKALSVAKKRNACFALSRALAAHPKALGANLGLARAGAVWVEILWDEPETKVYARLLGEEEALSSALREAIQGIESLMSSGLRLRQGSAFEDAGVRLMGAEEFGLWQAILQAQEIGQEVKPAGRQASSPRL